MSETLALPSSYTCQHPFTTHMLVCRVLTLLKNTQRFRALQSLELTGIGVREAASWQHLPQQVNELEAADLAACQLQLCAASLAALQAEICLIAVKLLHACRWREFWQ